jgi:hypothetical protein
VTQSDSLHLIDVPQNRTADKKKFVSLGHDELGGENSLTIHPPAGKGKKKRMRRAGTIDVNEQQAADP